MVSSAPNILVILTDQQQASMMSCAGNPWVRTPAMDSLAARGTRFERAYCSNPVCVPSRFSLMTGLMPSEVGLVSNRSADVTPLTDEQRRTSLGWALRSAGYDTGYGGKTHLPRMTAEDVGFEHISTDERDALPDACAEFIARPRSCPFALVASFVNPHDICYMAIRDSQANDAEKRLISRGVVECATLDRALTRPVGVTDEEFFARLCPPAPGNLEPQSDEPEAIARLVEHRPFRLHARRAWSDRRWREHRWAYARLTEIVDEQIGRLLAALDRLGRRQDTLIVFTSDHGDMNAAHRLEHKSTLYEEACRVPLIVSPPGAAKGAINRNFLTSNGLDLLPTLCDYADVPTSAGRKGVSLRPIVEGRATPERPCIPVESAVGRAVVTQRYKYARYDLGAECEQVYDLVEDRGEMRNDIATVPVATLADLRARFREAFGAALRKPDIITASAVSA